MVMQSFCLQDQCVEAHEQKQLVAKKNSVLFNQHHQVHLVRHHSNKAIHTDTPFTSSGWKWDWIKFFPSNASECLPLLSAETREEERGGAEEETVGGSGARENPEQITILQRGQGFSLYLLSSYCSSPFLLIKVHTNEAPYSILLCNPPQN